MDEKVMALVGAAAGLTLAGRELRPVAALGAGGVVSVASLLRDGPRPTVITMMRTGMRGREMAAELSEQVQDLYAEAQAQRAEPSGEG